MLNRGEVSTLYDEGMSQRAIAGRMGVSQATISRLMRDAGLTARRSGTIGHLRGPDNPGWKGDEASYSVLHNRVIALRGQPDHCEECGHSGAKATGRDAEYQWASVSGDYADPLDYRRLCRSCHMLFDDVGRRSNAARIAAGHQSPRGPDGRFLSVG